MPWVDGTGSTSPFSASDQCSVLSSRKRPVSDQSFVDIAAGRISARKERWGRYLDEWGYGGSLTINANTGYHCGLDSDSSQTQHTPDQVFRFRCRGPLLRRWIPKMTQTIGMFQQTHGALWYGEGLTPVTTPVHGRLFDEMASDGGPRRCAEIC